MTRRRRGFTLIEMLIVMGVAAVMMAVASLTIALLMRSERVSGESLLAAQAGHRFERRFRNDVHTASAATVDSKTPGRPLLTLTADRQPTITWSSTDGGLRRTVASQPPHVDIFRLSASNISFSLESTGPPHRRRELVTVTAIPRIVAEPHPREAWPTRLTAALNRGTSTRPDRRGTP